MRRGGKISAASGLQATKLIRLPEEEELFGKNLLTAAFKLEVNSLFTAWVSGSVVEELAVCDGLISWSSAFEAAELSVALSVVDVLPVPKRALTC